MTQQPGSPAESPQVRQYFEATAQEFDAIYSGAGKSALRRWLDRFFRRDMFQRYEQGLAECSAPDIATVLDIGTGSGRFALALARAGRQVRGLDFSAAMIDLARQQAAQAGLADRCRFEVGDFLAMEFPEPFDALLAVGLFDYIRDPAVFLARMRRTCRRKLVATFPVRWTWRAPLRRLRLGLQGCPVYFFSPADIRRLMAAAGFEVARLDRLGKIYFVVARPAP